MEAAAGRPGSHPVLLVSAGPLERRRAAGDGGSNGCDTWRFPGLFCESCVPSAARVGDQRPSPVKGRGRETADPAGRQTTFSSMMTVATDAESDSALGPRRRRCDETVAGYCDHATAMARDRPLRPAMRKTGSAAQPTRMSRYMLVGFLDPNDDVLTPFESLRGGSQSRLDTGTWSFAPSTPASSTTSRDEASCTDCDSPARQRRIPTRVGRPYAPAAAAATLALRESGGSAVGAWRSFTIIPGRGCRR